MLKRIIIWVLVIGLAFFLISTLAKNKDSKTGRTSTNVGRTTSSSDQEIARFEDDDVAVDKKYDIKDDDDRKKQNTVELDEEDRAYDDGVATGNPAITTPNPTTTNTKPTSNSTTSKQTPKPTTPASSILNRKYLVVAGSYKERNNADIMVKKLQKMGYKDAEVFTFDFAEYYSVTAGRYASESEAQKTTKTLKSKGIEVYTHKMRSKYFD